MHLYYSGRIKSFMAIRNNVECQYLSIEYVYSTSKRLFGRTVGFEPTPLLF